MRMLNSRSNIAKVHKRKLIALLLIVFVILCIGVIIGKVRNNNSTYSNTVSIILSPHFDDAAFSLGGLIAKDEHPIVVASFFTAAPTIATTTHWDTISGFTDSTIANEDRTKENTQALNEKGVMLKNYDYLDHSYDPNRSNEEVESDIAKDIQALIASYNGKTVNVYAPGYYNDAINHPDHILIHNAFLDVAENYPQTGVNFYIYEDYPYVERFTKQSVISVKKNLENNSHEFFDTETIPLTSADVTEKKDSISKYTSQIEAFKALNIDIISGDINYTSTRCGINPNEACEIVYKLHQ